jgi:lipopolysaccharide export system protein LptA
VRSLRFAALLILLAPGLVVAATAESSDPRLAIGVAPFEGVADSGVVLPDLATLLADRLTSQGALRVIGPAGWGASAMTDPSAEKIRRWAEKAGVEAVLVGRTTGLAGEPVRLSVTLFSGSTGGAGETRVVEISEPDETGPAMDRLAAFLAEDADGLVSSPPPAAELAEGNAPFGLSIDKSQPLSIRSDELEASKRNGARHLIFRKNVEVTQADVTIRTRRLEAFYPPDSKQPSRLIATGDVVLTKGTREARCDSATYDRVGQKLTCTGNAQLRDGADEVAGERIEFDLASEAVNVSGAAAVRFHPGGADTAKEESAP